MVTLETPPYFDSKVPVVAKILSNEEVSSRINRQLVVEVVEGRGLKAMDRGGTSDPYVTLSVGRGKHKDKRGESKVISKCLDPKWNQEILLLVSEKELVHDLLCIQVFDKDVFASDDLIGQLSLPLSSLHEANPAQHPHPEEKWYTIHNHFSGDVTGEVKLRFIMPPAARVPLALQPAPPRLCLVVYVVAGGILKKVRFRLS